MRALFISLFVTTAVGCGSDLSGIYQTTRASVDAAGCGAGTTTSTPAFVMVQQSSVLGTTVHKVKFCTSAEPASCSSSFESLATQGLLDASGTGGFSSGSPDGAGCAIIDVYTQIERDGDTLTVTAQRREGTVAGSCEASELSSHRDELTCKSSETIVGTFVADAPDGEDDTLSL